MFLISRHTFLKDTGCRSKKVQDPEAMSHEEVLINLDMLSLKKEKTRYSFQIFEAVGWAWVKMSGGIGKKIILCRPRG